MENIKERFDLTEVTDEFVAEVLPNAEELDLTAAQIKVLALLKYISRIDKKDEDGYFFVENEFIRTACKIGSKSTLNNAFGVLQESGYIERISGKKKVKGEKIVTSKYKVNCTTNCTTKPIENQQVIESVQPKCTSNCTTNCTVELELDKELDIEKEKDIYNIIKENNNILINIIEEKENNIINNIIKEKENSSSIESNNKEIKTNTKMEKELQQQINELKEQNEILTSRLNNCAKQFKVMMNTIAKLQSEVAELKKESKTSNKVNNKENKTINVDVKPTTASIEQDDIVSQPTVKEALEVKKEAFQSPIEELNETFDAEAIVEEFKETFTDVKEAQAKQIELIDTFKKAGLNYYNCCELQRRISKYIKSLELINSTAVEEELPQELPTVEEVKTIPTVEVKPIEEKLQELPQEAIKEAEEVIESRKEEEATEGKESTFVGDFQTNDSNSSIGEQMLRYQDIKTKVYYPTLDTAQTANVNPMFLYDSTVGRCVSSYQ